MVRLINKDEDYKMEFNVTSTTIHVPGTALQKYAKQMLENNELAEKGIKTIDRITNFTTTLVTGSQGEYGDITNIAEGLAHEC